MRRDLNLLALVRGADRYLFIYDDSNKDAVLDQLDRFAADPELSFTWFDAAILGAKVRQQPVPPSATIPSADPKRF